MDGTRFATKWVKQSGPAWKGWFGLTGDEFHQRYLELRSEFRPLDVGGYNTPSGVRYTVIWERNVAGVDWEIHRDVSRSGMQALADEQSERGFVPVRVEA